MERTLPKWKFPMEIFRFFCKWKTSQASKTLKNVVNYVKHALHVTKTCHVSLTNIHCFMLQTKHFHWSSRHSCLGNCLIWKINVRKNVHASRLNANGSKSLLQLFFTSIASLLDSTKWPRSPTTTQADVWVKKSQNYYLRAKPWMRTLIPSFLYVT